MEDASSTRYVCPFCPGNGEDANEFRSVKELRDHITQSGEGEHKGKDGYKIDKTIQRIHPIKEIYDDEVDQKILRFAENPEEYGCQEINNEVINEISDHGIPKGRIFYVLRENDIDYEWIGREQSSRWGQLSEKQQKILQTRWRDPDMQPSEIAEELGFDLSWISDVLDKYEWMLGKGMIPTDYVEGEEKTVGVDEALEDDRVKRANIYAGIGIDFHIEIDDDEFTVIQRLIEEGYEDMAREIFDYASS